MKQYDYSISLIRCVSMCCIVSCHIMQYLGSELAWWLNVGVQIFLCLSGYLYGDKRIDGIRFLKRSFRKILVGYYIVLIPCGLIALLWLKTIDLTRFCRALFMSTTISGGEHLWFVPVILCCYLFTSILSESYENVRTVKKWAKYTLGWLVLTYIVFKYFFYFFSPVWMSCYLAGFALKRLEMLQGRQIYLTEALPLLVLTAMMNGVRIISSYYAELPIPDFERFCSYSHALLGISLFVVFRKCFRNVGAWPILKFSDKYSYEIYLVHQFVILGPMSLMRITSRKYFNIAVILAIILILAVILKTLTLWVNSAIDHRSRNTALEAD